MKNATILLAVVAVLAMATSAQANTYWQGDSVTGGTTDYGTTGNWDNGVPHHPTNGTAYISGTTSNVTVDLTTDQSGLSAGSVYVGGSAQLAGSTVTFNVSHNFNSVSGASLHVGNSLADNSKVYMNQTAGAHTASGSSWMKIGAGTAAGTTAVYTISGGTINRGLGGLQMAASSAAGHVEFKVDGVIGTNPNANDITFYYTQVDTGSLITFVLEDHALAITPNHGTATKINLTYGIGGSGYLRGKIRMDLSNSPTLALGDKILLFDNPGASSFPLNVTATFEDATKWDFAYDYYNDDPNNNVSKVYAEYQIPEPATMCLLGLGGIGVLLRRRRK